MTIAAQAPAVEGHALRGVLLVSDAVFLFALGDVATKHLAQRYPVSVVMAVRYLASVAMLLALLWPRNRTSLWRTERTALVMVMVWALCLAGGSLTMGLALRLMPVGEAVSIIYLAPFAVMLLAVPLLGERVSTSGWVGAAVGFLGVLLIVRPGGGLDPLGVVFALLKAACSTAYHLLTRVLARTETTVAMLFHTTLLGAAVFGALALAGRTGAMPAPSDAGLMVLLGALATGGHFLFTAAYREASASLLAPVNYLHLVWAAALGWAVFGHVPGTVSLIGMIAVAAAGMGVALRAQLERT